MADRSLLRRLGPGILVAATGVGAGDLATASFCGSQLGTAVLWAVVAGAALKYVLTEGLARWQLATGQTLLEGLARRAGPWAGWLFLPYLVLWSFFVGSALISACGVTLHALWPVWGDPVRGKIAFGAASSLLALAFVWKGGYRLFQRTMNVCVALMFITVVTTAVLLWPGTEQVLTGLLLPYVPVGDGSGPTWTVALIGGVGGTLTILCYGYWIRAEDRSGLPELPACRVDLAAGYVMTALFGMGMVIVGSSVVIRGSGAALLVTLADRLLVTLGPAGRLAFLLGALGAVFSSLLGVWQAVPYLFADVWRLFLRPAGPARAGTPDDQSAPYRWYLLGLSVMPLFGLFVSFREVQKLYAVIGAAFMPLLAIVLLWFNGRAAWVGAARNGWPTRVALAAALALFGYMAWAQWST